MPPLPPPFRPARCAPHPFLTRTHHCFSQIRLQQIRVQNICRIYVEYIELSFNVNYFKNFFLPTKL